MAVSRPALARYPPPGLSSPASSPRCRANCRLIAAQKASGSSISAYYGGPNQGQSNWHHHGVSSSLFMPHATSFSGIWPLLSTVTLVTSWATLRRDRPNRSAMARWLSGCPAETEAA